MKNKHYLLASALLACSCLTGCTDAQAKLNDSSTALFSVGSKTVTKGDLYSKMNKTSGASVVTNNATKTISAAEIEVTDDMQESAESTLKSYKSMYGDTFTSYLENNNMTEDDYLNDYLIPSLQAEKLPEAYLEQNWDNVVSLYSPVKATILEFSSSDDAQAALSELKDGSKTASEAASGHNSSSTGESKIYTIEDTDLDSIVRSCINANTPDDGWSEVPASDGSTFYVVKVDDNDPDNFKDECIQTLESVSQVKSDATTYFFKKYNFHVYDKTIYDAIEEDYPDYLVQDMQDDDTTTTTSSTSSSSESSTNE
jgi:foldase protein PrsA